jgi:peptidoglycan hydrolase-like protein with peptidoglycan-binding domain
MGALQAKLVFLAFIGLSAVIAYNAMYLQNGPHSVRYSADVESLNNNARVDRTATGSAGAPRSRMAKPETVRAVQRQLASKGYEPGPADGVHGLFTRAAVMAFQHDNDLPVTGEVSEALLKQVIFGSSAGHDTDPGKTEIPEETVALIKAVQEILAKMGYEPGPVDGIMGPGTAAAIRKFEEQQKMPAKGRISGALLKTLISVTGAKLASIQSR